MTQPLPPRYRHNQLILAICCMSLFIVSLDVTIVNVALPSIGKELHATVSGLQWTLDAYTLVLASLLVLAGSTADRVGRRRIFQIGLALFSIGSLLCSAAPSVGVLIAARVLQAIGGSMMNPVALSIITTTFTDPRQRARAVGIWGAVVGVSLGLGPLVGGILTEAIGWRAIFWVNAPIGVGAIVLTALFVPESKGQRARKLDPVGQVLVVLVLSGLVFGLIEGPELGWASAATIGAFVVSAAALVMLIRYESRTRNPSSIFDSSRARRSRRRLSPLSSRSAHGARSSSPTRCICRMHAVSRLRSRDSAPCRPGSPCSCCRRSPAASSARRARACR